MHSRRSLPALAFLAVCAALLAAYLPTLQRIPNGSDQYYMIDVGETQVVLNVWGTLHPTGYPLYTLLGGALVALFKAVGVSPVTAPALVSLLWGFAALGLLYVLALNLTGRVLPAALMTLMLGLARTVWIHHAIAEIYTFGLAILALLLLLALWRGPVPGRVYWLALVGGIGVAHHRALALAAPALVYAVWPELARAPRRLPRILIASGALGLIGFLPYVYLPLRAQAGAAWVYGDPGTWAGFWDQFFAREYDRFIGAPGSWDAMLANAATVNEVLITDVTAHGVLAGLVGLAFGIAQRRHRRAAITIALTGLAAYAFHVGFYTDILSALILSVLVSLAFGWLFLMDRVLTQGEAAFPRWKPAVSGIVAAWALMLAVLFAGYHAPILNALTANPTGLETIDLVAGAPPGATVMLAWGPRFFAAGLGRDVLGQLDHLELVDHTADYRDILARGRLVTPEYTFYNQPLSWWEDRIGQPVYLRAAAPYLVEIATEPERGDGDSLDSIDAVVECAGERIILSVAWYTPTAPAEDLSVFAHLVDASGNVLAQADQFAPVYGWRPLTTWTPGEVVRDVYPLPRVEGAAAIHYGLYRRLSDGQFKNTVDNALPVDCDE